MEATNVFGAENPSAPFIATVTLEISDCAMTCIGGPSSASAADERGACMVPTVQWPGGVRSAGRRNKRAVATPVPRHLSPKQCRPSHWIEHDPAIALRPQNLQLARGSGIRCRSMLRAASVVAAGTPLVEKNS